MFQIVICTPCRLLIINNPLLVCRVIPILNSPLCAYFVIGSFSLKYFQEIGTWWTIIQIYHYLEQSLSFEEKHNTNLRYSVSINQIRNTLPEIHIFHEEYIIYLFSYCTPTNISLTFSLTCVVINRLYPIFTMMSSLQIALNERKVELKVIITLPHMINTAIIRLHGMQIICKCFVFIQQIGIQIIYRRF